MFALVRKSKSSGSEGLYLVANRAKIQEKNRFSIFKFVHTQNYRFSIFFSKNFFSSRRLVDNFFLKRDNRVLEEDPESLRKDGFRELYNEAITLFFRQMRARDIIFSNFFVIFFKFCFSVLALKFLFRKNFLLWKKILKAREKTVLESFPEKR